MAMSYPNRTLLNINDLQDIRWRGMVIVCGRLRAVQTAVALTRETGKRCEVRHFTRSGLWLVLEQGGPVGGSCDMRRRKGAKRGGDYA